MITVSKTESNHYAALFMDFWTSVKFDSIQTELRTKLSNGVIGFQFICPGNKVFNVLENRDLGVCVCVCITILEKCQ
jgi:hypothetical protein